MKSKHLVIDANGKNGEFKKLEDIKDFISVENVQTPEGIMGVRIL